MNGSKALLSFLMLLLFSIPALSQKSLNVKLCPIEGDASFRGVSVVNDNVAWISGSGGTVAMTANGGKNWRYIKVPQFENFDFRSIYAFDSLKVIIVNAGAPTNILMTEDGGRTWRVVYQLVDDAAFVDGIDFWNDQEGLIYGDPINGRMLLISTSDGGRTWIRATEDQSPKLFEGEASFAASGTGIRCLADNKLVISTGGKKSRLFFSDKTLTKWKSVDPPILQGESTTGIFSVAFSGLNNAIIVGGDYARDSLKVDHVFYTHDSGETWAAPVSATRGYRECVEFLDESVAVAVGPTGIDITHDKGESWMPLSHETNFHVMKKARNGNLLVLAGGKGKVAVLKR